MGVLLQYNNATSYTYEDLQKNTALSPEALNPALGILVKAKVLLLGEGQTANEPGTRYNLNLDFKK